MDKSPLTERSQLELLLNEFYERVKRDALIGPIFNDLAQVDWETHVPKIHDFWASLLFGESSYRGRPFPPHIPLGLRKEHFERWLQIFFAVVDERHEGGKAEEIKARAWNIGRNFLRNIQLIGASIERP